MSGQSPEKLELECCNEWRWIRDNPMHLAGLGVRLDLVGEFGRVFRPGIARYRDEMAGFSNFLSTPRIAIMSPT